MITVSLFSGHGQALLAYLYDLARSRDSVFEITVEDPAPGFEKVPHTNLNLTLGASCSGAHCFASLFC